MTEREKFQRELLAAIHARRFAACNTSQLARDLGASRTETQAALDRASFAGLVFDAGISGGAYRWRAPHGQGLCL